MAKPTRIKTLAVIREIPFNQLVLSKANVRTVKTGVSIEALSEDIAHRGLLQNLYVRPVIGADGEEMRDTPVAPAGKAPGPTPPKAPEPAPYPAPPSKTP